MKILVIPDVHLKPWMFDRAEELFAISDVDNFVILGDIVDDFMEQENHELYSTTMDRAMHFAVDHPDSLWCWGNHDVCYVHEFAESGYSFQEADFIKEKISKFSDYLGDRLKYIHKIDNVLFSHGGVSKTFVKKQISNSDGLDSETIINKLNNLNHYSMWTDSSPLWYRPQYESNMYPRYRSKDILQVVGHTPVKHVNKDRNIICCDTFSTYSNGSPYGDRTFTIVDTNTWEFSVFG